eukprot:scaffold1566_cov150-Skeletonema_menzelii.AAC.3
MVDHPALQVPALKFFLFSPSSLTLDGRDGPPDARRPTPDISNLDHEPPPARRAPHNAMMMAALLHTVL